MPLSPLTLVIILGARREILLKIEMISAIVAGCSEAIILVRTRGLSLASRNAATIAAAASLETM